MKLSKLVLMCGSTGIALSLASPAFAQTTSMQDQISALEAQIAILRAQVDAQNSNISVISDRVEQVPVRAGANPTASPQSNPQKGDGFKVGDTTIKVSGFIDADVHFTKFSDGSVASESVGRDQYVPFTVPVAAGGGSPGDDGFVNDFTVQSSRLAVSTDTPVKGDSLKTHIEMDFLLTPGGNEILTNSSNPRLRRAYVDYKGFRVGQEWSTFQALQAIPESASFYAPAESQVFIRQPQIRYTNGNFQIALENPGTFSTLGFTDDSIVPDVIARYNFKGARHNISLSGLARQLKVSNGTIDDSAFGYDASLAGRFNVGEKDDIRFSLQGGEGIGRYIGLGILRDASLNADGDGLNAIGGFSGNIAYRKVFGDTSLSTGYSFITIDNETGFTDTSNASSQSAFLALTRKLAPKMTVSGEFLYGEREIESGETGNIQRFTFSVRQGF